MTHLRSLSGAERCPVTLSWGDHGCSQDRSRVGGQGGERSKYGGRGEKAERELEGTHHETPSVVSLKPSPQSVNLKQTPVQDFTDPDEVGPGPVRSPGPAPPHQPPSSQ
jgi:hypothetical protein